MVVRTNDGHPMGKELEVEDGWLFVDNEQNPSDKKFKFGDMDFQIKIDNQNDQINLDSFEQDINPGG